jgi:GNAT superfamily N-acetyltransferase
MYPFVSPPSRLFGEVFALAFRNADGYEAHLWPHATLALTGARDVWWGNVAVIGDDPQPEDRLRHAVAVFRERALPGWMLFADTVADRLAPLAASVGLRDGGTCPVMVYRPPTRPPDSGAAHGFGVGRVHDEAGVREANLLAAAAYDSPVDAINRIWGPLLLEMPGFDLFVARRDGVPISTVMTIRHNAGVGIWTMATPPALQRQGGGRAVLEYAIGYHMDRGADTFYLGGFEAGKRLYDQIGFQTVSVFQVWIAPSANGSSDQ